MPHFDVAKRACLAAIAGLVLGIVGCAEAPRAPTGPKKDLVYPAAPDEPRFYYERTITSSADVGTEVKDDGWRRFVTGEGGGGEGLGKPYAVAVHKGRVYVSDSATSSVRVFDFPNKKYFKIGEDEENGLGKPLGLDVDDNGTLYVVDVVTKTIVVYDTNGKFLRRIAGAKWFDRLTSVTVDPAGKRLYVVDIGGIKSEQHRVRVFDAQTGDHLFDFGKRGTGPGEFNLPRDLAISKNGEVYVVDGGNFRIQVFDLDGKYLRSFGEVGRSLGQFARPKEVAVGGDGNIYVVDAAFGNFQIFTPKGELLMFIGERSESNGPAKYMLPSGIAVDEDGRVYMVDQWFKKVDVFRPANLRVEDGWLAKRITPAKPGSEVKGGVTEAPAPQGAAKAGAAVPPAAGAVAAPASK